MPLQAGDRANYQTLLNAAGDNNLALVECKDLRQGRYVAVLCAINVQPNEQGEPEYQMVPLARMFSGNPYEEVVPLEPDEAEPPLPEEGG